MLLRNELQFTKLGRESVWPIAVLILLVFVAIPVYAVDYVACENATVEFENPNPFWVLDDAEGTGIQWGNLAECGQAENYTGGSGDAFCATAGGFGGPAFDTTFETESFSLQGATNATLNFKLNYQDLIAGFDRLDLDIRFGGGWVNVASWFADVGANQVVGSGVQILVNLNPYLGEDNAKLRWRYYDPGAGNDNGSYVQIDDVEIDCTGGADLGLNITTDKPTVIEGEAVTFLLEGFNDGPMNSSDVFATALVPSGFIIQDFSFTDGLVLPASNSSIFGQIPALASGESTLITVEARALMAPEVTLDVLSPAAIAGNYEAQGALFGPPLNPASPLTGLVVLVDDGTLTVDDGCEPIANGAALNGNIALMFDSVECSYDEQVKNAQKVGAAAAIVVDEVIPAGLEEIIIFEGAGFDVMSSSGNVTSPITIPSLLVKFETGDAIKSQLASSPMVTLTGIKVLSQERKALGFIGGSDIMDPGFSVFNPDMNNFGRGGVIILKDSDQDGLPDLDDGCPDDSQKTSGGICGCGASESDLNANGIIDCVSTEELKDQLARAKGLVRKLKRVKLSGNAKKDKNRRKKQKAIQAELKALLDEIVATVLNPLQPILTIDATVDLQTLVDKARAKGRKATKTKSSKFKKNKKKAKRALNDVEQVLG